MSTKLRCTHRQRDFLVDYMVCNPAFARAEYAGPYSLRELDAEWLNLKYMLREYGPDKPVLAWKRTWRELKKKARMSIRKPQTQPIDDPSMNNIYSKILSVIVHRPVKVSKKTASDWGSKPNPDTDTPASTQWRETKNSDFTHYFLKNNQLLRCGILQLKLETNMKIEQNSILRQRNELLKQSMEQSMSRNAFSEDVF